MEENTICMICDLPFDHVSPYGCIERLKGVIAWQKKRIENDKSRLSTLEAALSLSTENVERYHKELELFDGDIRHMISGIRRRVGLEG